MKTKILCVLFAMGLLCGAEEPIAFLGVGTQPLEDEERLGLAIPKGIGLKVDEVVAGAPAEGALDFGDVLVKIDDQWLAHPDQLSALVRMRSPGDTLRLEVLRDGEKKTVSLTLGQRMLPLANGEESSEDESPPADPFATAPEVFRFEAGVNPLVDAGVIRMLQQQQQLGRILDAQAGGAGNVRTSRRVQVVENGTRITIVEQDGKTSLLAIEGDKEVFRGSVDTPEERAKVPAPLRTRLQERGLLQKDERNLP